MTEEQRKEAARQRTARYRERLKVQAEKHRTGDHSECRPHRCEVAAAAVQAAVDLDAAGLNEAAGDTGEGVTGDVTATPQKPVSHPDPPARLGERGLRLWNEMAGLKLDPTHVLTLERICRMADRLERLDEQLDGGDWLRVAKGHLDPDEGVLEVHVVVNKPIGELRQLELAIKHLIAELRHAQRAAAPVAGVTAVLPSQGGGDDDDDEPGERRSGNVTSIAGIFGRSAPG